jgi:ABC-2 type transport system permease protein
MSVVSLQRKKSKVFRELNTVFAVFARELTVFFKSPGTAIISFAMPIVMMGMIGGNLMQNLTGSLDFDFGVFMLVGMIVNMLFMITSMGIISLIDDGEIDFNQEMLVAPVSRYSLVVGKIFGAMIGAVFSVAGTLVVGFFMGIVLPLERLLPILALSPLMCLSGGAFAIIIIGIVKSRKTANLGVMLIVMVQMFLSGVIIPINNSSGALMYLSRIMPMTYCLDLTRAVIYAGTDEYSQIIMFDPMINFTIIVILTLVCLVIGTLLFANSEKNR